MRKELTKEVPQESTSALKEQLAQELPENIEVMTPGAMLNEARVSLQLTPLDIAKKLNLRESLILAIEENEFDEMTSLTFTRGYLKAYAKLVHVADEDILQAFDYWNNAGQQQLEMQSFSQSASQRAQDNLGKIITYFVLVVIIVSVMIWWFQRNDSQSDNPPMINTDSQSQAVTAEPIKSEPIKSEPINSEPATPVVDDQPAAIDIAIEQQSPAETAVTETIEAGSVEVSRVAVETNINETPAVVDTPAIDPDGPALSHLELRFSDDCWINIADARGERIAIGTKNKGHLTSVYGVPPFTIKLGNPSVVSIELEGEQRAIPYYPKGRVANFELALKAGN